MRLRSSVAACALWACGPRQTASPQLRSEAPSRNLPASTPSAAVVTQAPAGVEAGGREQVARPPLDQAELVAPQNLACIARWYGGEPTWNGQWNLAIGGELIGYDDGKQKSFQERLRAADLEDMFHDAYEPGSSARLVSTENHDPGRFRAERLFKITYGSSEAEVRARLVPVTVLGRTVLIHTRVAGALERVAQKLQTLTGQSSKELAVLSKFSGSFIWRRIEGTDQLSAHAFGIALDLNAEAADYWRWTHDRTWRHPLPFAVVVAFEEEGFAWGGRWYHFDTMHFEYRPELFEPNCR